MVYKRWIAIDNAVFAEFVTHSMKRERLEEGFLLYSKKDSVWSLSYNLKFNSFNNVKEGYIQSPPCAM